MQPIKIFCSYARNFPDDQKVLNQLEKHLANLVRQGQIEIWYDRKTVPGRDVEGENLAHLKEADIILLFVSPEYMHSDYCDNEAKRAVHMENMGIASVRVLLLLFVDWEDAPFGWCQVLPKSRRFVSKWPDKNEAFLHIVEGIKEAIQETRKNRAFREITRKELGTAFFNEANFIPVLPPIEALRIDRQTEEIKPNRQTEEIKRNKRTEELGQRRLTRGAKMDGQVFAAQSTTSDFISAPKKKMLPSSKRKRRNTEAVIESSNWQKRARHEYDHVSKGNRGIYFFSLLILDLVVLPMAALGWSNNGSLWTQTIC